MMNFAKQQHDFFFDPSQFFGGASSNRLDQMNINSNNSNNNLDYPKPDYSIDALLNAEEKIKTNEKSETEYITI